MASSGKTAGVGLMATLAVPVAGLSGVMTAVMLLILAQAGVSGMGPAAMSTWGKPTWWQLLTSGWMLCLLISLAIFVLTIRFLVRLQARCKALVAKINASEGLSLDAEYMLGYPGADFLVFDRQHQKLAACTVADDGYQVHDFSWVLGWQVTWREVESMEMGGGSRQVNATGMSVPTFERTVRAKDFAIELRVADPQRPRLSFAMSRRAAETWCARLGAIFNS